MPRSRENQNDDDRPLGGLDLGLSALLNAVSAGDAGATAAQQGHFSSPSADPSPLPTDSTPVRQRSEFEVLADAHQWVEIIHKAEARLAHGNDPETRLWWIQAHLERRSMPASFLTAPLDSVLSNLAVLHSRDPNNSQRFSKEGAENPVDRGLVEKTAQAVFARLESSGDTQLALSVSRSMECAGFVVRGKSGELVPATLGGQTTMQSASAQSPDLTAAAALVSPSVFGTNSSSVALGDATRRSSERPVRGGTRGLLIAILLIILVVAPCAWFAFTNPLLAGYLSGSAGVIVAAEQFVEEPHLPELQIPNLERRDAVGSLSALFYSIEANAERAAADAGQRDSTNGQSSASVSAVVPAVDKSTGGTVAVSGASNESNGQANRGTGVAAQNGSPAVTNQGGAVSVDAVSVKDAPAPKKERINTKGPIEAPDFPKRASRSNQQTPPRPSLRSPEQQRRSQDSGGRGSNGSTISGSGAPLPGPDIVMGKPVEGFSQGGIFRVLARTSVVSDPAFSARVIGRLEPGDRVMVEARIGDWLRLRSVRGRGGFVLAQDVSDGTEEDFKQ